MFEELKQDSDSKKSSRDSDWLKTDPAKLLDPGGVDELFEELVKHGEVTAKKKEGVSYCIPQFGASTLKGKGVEVLCETLREGLRDSLQPLGRTPSTVLFKKQQSLWCRIVSAYESFYTTEKLKKALKKLSEEEQDPDKKDTKKDEAGAKKSPRTADDVLIETGVRTGLNLVFSLLRQAWAQCAWQRQMNQLMLASGGEYMYMCVNCL